MSIQGQNKPIFVLIMAIIAKVSLILGKISRSCYSKYFQFFQNQDQQKISSQENVWLKDLFLKSVVLFALFYTNVKV